MKLLISIQKTSRKAKYARSSRETSSVEPINTEEISKFFPHTKNYELLEKLSKACNERQQWLTYIQSSISRNRRDSSSFKSRRLNRHDVPRAIRDKSKDSKEYLASYPPYSQPENLDSVSTSVINHELEPDKTKLSQGRECMPHHPQFFSQPIKRKTARIPRLPKGATLGHPFMCYLCRISIDVNSTEAWMYESFPQFFITKKLILV